MKGANQAFADSVFLAVKGYVDAAFARFSKQAIDPIERRLSEIPAGRDGKDADPADIERAVEKAIAALPKPADGKDADADAIAEVVLGKVTQALEAIPAPKDGRDGKDADPDAVKAAIDAEVARVLATWDKPRDGIDGKSVDMAELSEQIADAASKAVQALPPAPAGKDGKDGTSVSLDDVRTMLAEMVAKAVSEVPVQKGEPGKDGENIDPEFVRAELQKMVDAIPRPADGLRGEKGEDGRDGRDGRDAKGEPGRDALQIDILPAIDETRSYPRATYAHLRGGVVRSIRTTEPLADGDFEKAGWVVFIDGETAYDVTQADERTFTVRREMLSGKVFERSFAIPAVVDREVYREGEAYKRGDGVTWGRHFWIARRDTTAKPEAGDDWRLAVKSGRDGADAYWVARRNGFAGTETEWLASLRGKEGKPGKDLTQQNQDGRKF